MANAKALGIVPGDAPGIDATITFNSSVSFDFDPSDGITPGTTDIIGVATHEIGHAMGFVSGVDTVDTFTCLLYTSPSPRDRTRSRMPSSA